MEFIWDISSTANWVISLIVIVLVYAFVLYVFTYIIKRKIGYAFVALSFTLALLSFIFSLLYAFIIVVGLSTVFIIISMFSNLGEIRRILANPFKVQRVKNAKLGVEKIYNREEFYKTIESAVLSMSKTRTGALMTFEKSTSLVDVIKNGVLVKAPVTTELLQTIFYPGTRLHDGAVVIKDNMIVAAAVFYTPTTKPFAGKYGSRHRAAIGISEISDSVTVIVSEETGRISFAVSGQLETVTPENFTRVFENYMEGFNEEE